MAETDIAKTTVTDFTNAQEDYSVDSEQTDGPTDQKETTYINAEWSQQLGYYKKTPKLHSDIDTKARWTVGRGFKADKRTTIILDTIRGFGKDTFNTIMENMIRVSHIGGDAFAEIITNPLKRIINLKPLDPGVMRIVSNRQGIIIRYEQVNKTKKAVKKFQPEQIFHLSRNRVADEIHGTSIIPAVEQIILMINEAMTDWKKVMHRNVAPVIIHHMDTDDTVKIAAYKAQVQTARTNMENIFIPKGNVEIEVMATAQNATLNPLPWIDVLTQYFHQATGVPDIVSGGGSVSLTDAASKIKYLSFEQTIREEQLYDEEQVLAQLNMVVTFEMPAMLENDMMSGKQNEQDAGSVALPQPEPVQGPEPNDTTAEVKGKT